MMDMRLFNKIKRGNKVKYKNKKCGNVLKQYKVDLKERKISMYPMDYEEFLWAIGDTSTFSLLKKCFDMNQGLGDSINRKQLRQL